MNKLKRILDFLINNGVEEEYLLTEKRRIVLTNVTYLLGAFVSSFFAFRELIYQNKLDMYFNIFLALFFIVFAIINHKGYRLVGRLGVALTSVLMPIAFSYFYDREAGLLLYYFPILVGLFMLFSYEEKKYLIFNISAMVVIGFLLEFYDYDLFGRDAKLSEPYQKESYSVNLIFTSISTLFCLYWLVKQYHITEKELDTARQQAEYGMKMKSDFLSTMSHEIRTPLNGIIATVELLEKHKDHKNEELIDILSVSSNNLLQLVNSILNFSKLEADKINVEPVVFNLRDQIKHIENIMNIRLNNTPVLFFTKLDNNIPHLLKGDVLRLNQILINLLDNSIKFTERGKIRIDISIIKQTVNHIELIFKVEDTGIGIAESQLKTIFNSFTQLSNSTNRKYEGTGLGTTIVKKTIDLLNGEVKVESEVNKGTCFTVILPFEKVVEDEKIIVNEIKTDSFDNTSKKSLENKATILIVDDNPINLFICQKLLDELNTNILLAEDAKTAIHILQETNCDLILLDYHMPEVDGLETFVQIREHKYIKNNTLPVYFLTADVSHQIKENVANTDALGIIYKPLQKDLLLEKVNESLQISHKKRG